MHDNRKHVLTNYSRCIICHTAGNRQISANFLICITSISCGVLLVEHWTEELEVLGSILGNRASFKNDAKKLLIILFPYTHQSIG